MKYRSLSLLWTILTPGFAAEFTEPEFAPSAFKSTSEASDFADNLINGGEVYSLEIQNTKVLVIEVLGSGLPTVAILTYLADGKGWILRETWRPQSIEHFDVRVNDDHIFVVGMETHERWVIFPGPNCATAR